MKTEKGKYSSIRTKTGSILVLMFICLASAIYLILNTVMLGRIETLESKHIKEHVKRAHNAIDSELQHLYETAFDWAVWDDTYAYIRDKNEEYVLNNLHKDTFSNLKLSIMTYIDESGKYIFAGSIDNSKKEIVPVSQAFIEYIDKSPVKKNADPNYRIKGIIILPEGPMLIASCPILLSSGEGPVRGNVLVGFYLDDTKINFLAENLELNLNITRFDHLEQSELAPFNSVTREKPISVHGLSNDKIGGYSILYDIYEQPALGLKIEMDREISEIGRNGIKLILILLITVSFIFTFLILIFLDKNILLRLLELSKEIKTIGKERIFSKRLKPQKIQDELTVVSDEINSMLNKLEESQIQVIESEKALMKANENLEKRVEERTAALSNANERLQAEIIERERIQEKIHHLAYHDHLTGLSNRLLFNDKLNHAIHLTNRLKKMLAVMFLDLDGFKMINDTMGHAVGDQLLKEVSNRLVKTLRKSDIVSRIGGDEFIILIENIDNISTIKIVADKILKEFSEPFTLENQDCFLTTSIGVAVYPSDGKNAEVLIKNADIAMYKAKEKGKNQYVLCTPVMKTIVTETMKLTNELYRALERNELELYYQPQVSCNSNNIVGLEALIRWNHPKLGMISPGKFIPIAEQTGLIISIGEWIMRTACNQNKLWQDAGYPKIRMGVNLSVKQFHNPNLIKQVEEILAETGLEPNYLELEVTESITMKEKGYIVETLNVFKKMGVRIAIDDFGTEYSSLSYLKYLPADRIKIAMPFVQGIEVSTKDEAITKAIIVLAKSMGMGVIAEGVETANQLAFLTERMCDEIQGFYFFRPIPAAKVEELLKKEMEKLI
jgi:diguanylate cyclase (GGDEF)-like protein